MQHMIKCPNCGTEIDTASLNATLLKLKRVDMGTSTPLEGFGL